MSVAAGVVVQNHSSRFFRWRATINHLGMLVSPPWFKKILHNPPTNPYITPKTIVTGLNSGVVSRGSTGEGEKNWVWVHPLALRVYVKGKLKNKKKYAWLSIDLLANSESLLGTIRVNLHKVKLYTAALIYYSQQ